MVVLLSAAEINLLTAELEVRLLRKLRLRWVLTTLDGEPSLGGLHEEQVTAEDFSLDRLSCIFYCLRYFVFVMYGRYLNALFFAATKETAGVAAGGSALARHPGIHAVLRLRRGRQHLRGGAARPPLTARLLALRPRGQLAGPPG